MITAKRAPVKPRVLAEGSGEAVPLEDEILRLWAAGCRGAVRLDGPHGAGKTTALQHLAAVLPVESSVALFDGPGDGTSAVHRLVVLTATPSRKQAPLAVYSLARWQEDDVIEYLLAVHPNCCASVMCRLRAAPEDGFLEGLPELWRVVLDQMAAAEDVPDIKTALRKYLEFRLPARKLREQVRRRCLEVLTADRPGVAQALLRLLRLRRPGWGWEVKRVLRHTPVQILLVAEQILADLREGTACAALAARLPREVIHEVAPIIAADPGRQQRLKEIMAGDGDRQPMGASILHAADVGWIPEPGRPIRLMGAYLEHAAWPDVQLPGSNLGLADLSGADLRRANLSGVQAPGINLRGACLHRACLDHFNALFADLAGADLSYAAGKSCTLADTNLERANLEGAVLRKASFKGSSLVRACLAGTDLRKASLWSADVRDADFRNANLEGAWLEGVRLREACFLGARFSKAHLTGADLEGMELPGADFTGANLTNAVLTGTTLPDARLDNACLHGAYLAEIDWEWASLRGADLTGSTFHMGTARSGLVGSPLACEGSRTGFYTDDYDAQDFKAPEEIRKANLCHADLRGACITDVDFYLVDLRGALLDPEQEAHVRRCGAILEDRR